MSENSYRSSETPLTYKVLLVLTTLSSILFCWLYVTKPVEVTIGDDSTATSASDPTQQNEVENSGPQPTTSPPPKFQKTALSKPTDFLPPSENTLPGTPRTSTKITETSPNSKKNPIPLPNSSSTSGQNEYEETNDRIQHVITAQSGDQSERIILEVPVIYQTRGMRLGPQQAEEARRILRALKSYKSLVTKLHQDGQNISKAWELLLLDSQPIDALRADSPSLPQNSTYSSSVPTEKSASTISIENNQ